MVIPGLRPGFHGTPNNTNEGHGGKLGHKSAAAALGGGRAGDDKKRAPHGWQPPAHGWQQARIAAASGSGDSEVVRHRQGLVYTLTNAQIWKAYDWSSNPGGGGSGVRSLTRDELLAAFKAANGIDLDPGVVDAIYRSVDPGTGKKKYPDGQLPYHKFIFEMQLSAPYAGQGCTSGAHPSKLPFVLSARKGPSPASLSRRGVAYVVQRDPARGDDNQAYLYRWRKEAQQKIADAKAAKDAERRELEAIAAAKEKRDNAARVPHSVSRGSRASRAA